MERIVKNCITKITDSQLDPLQFAYHTGRGVDDAKVFTTDLVYKHFESPNTTARFLFADFSSAFNTYSHIFPTAIYSC